METASSKSLASSPSIVTIRKLRRSRRLLISSGGGSTSTSRASSRTPGGNESRRPCFLIITCRSKPGSPLDPSTSTTLPSGPLYLSGQEVILTRTLSPLFTFSFLGNLTKMVYSWRESSGTTWARFLPRSRVPTNS